MVKGFSVFSRVQIYFLVKFLSTIIVFLCITLNLKCFKYDSGLQPIRQLPDKLTFSNIPAIHEPEELQKKQIYLVDLQI